MTPIKIIVKGEAAPGGSKSVYFYRDSRGRPIIRDNQPLYKIVDAGKDNTKWKKAVKKSARVAMQAERREAFPKGVPLKFNMTFYQKRTKSHYGKGKNADTLNKLGRSMPYPAKDPDTTKLVRSTEDALTGIVWHDDNQVVSQSAHKRYGSPCVVITIEAMPTDEGLFEESQGDA